MFRTSFSTCKESENPRQKRVTAEFYTIDRKFDKPAEC